MKYFKFIGNIDVSAALEEVTANDHMFAPHTPRPEQSPPLREGRSIHLRIHDKNHKSDEISDARGAKELADKMLEAVDAEAFYRLPQCRKLINQAMTMTLPGSKLGRCYIAKMSPGGNIYPHVDPGKYFDLHDRYHIVLKTNQGVSFSCGSNKIENDIETVRFEQGELWVFDNKTMHWASNKGDEDRIHIIMDVRIDTLHFPH